MFRGLPFATLDNLYDIGDYKDDGHNGNDVDVPAVLSIFLLWSWLFIYDIFIAKTHIWCGHQKHMMSAYQWMMINDQDVMKMADTYFASWWTEYPQK